MKKRTRCAGLGYVYVLLISGVLSLALNLCAAGDSAEVKPSDCNIILIVVDCLRADHLSCYGYHRKTSPNIDALAAESAVFRQAVTQAPNTLLSFSSMFTSRYVSAHGVTATDRVLSDSALTLAEIFKIYNYKTAAFLGGWLLNPIFRLNQGFDEYYHLDYSSASFKTTLPEALEWVKEKGGKREKFFLLVHANDLHTPFAFPASSVYDRGFKVNPSISEDDLFRVYRKKLLVKETREIIDLSDDDMNHIIARYDEGINYVDGLIGDFIGKLRESELLDRTIIILTADHGEGLFDHDYFLHEFNLYGGTLKVPLIVKIPGMAKKEITRQVQLIDLMPTMLELAGIEVNKDAQGRSLKPLLSGKVDAGFNRYVCSENTLGGKAIRSDRWKLIWFPDKIELYDLKNDPMEHNNLAGVEAKTAEALKKELFSRLTAGEKDNLSEALPSSGGEFAEKMARTKKTQHRIYEKLPHRMDGARPGALR
ncbi:MAG: sulfatase [bacterium]